MCECLDDYNGVVGSNPTHGASRGSSVRKCWHQHFHWIEQKRHTKFLPRINSAPDFTMAAFIFAFSLKAFGERSGCLYVQIHTAADSKRVNRIVQCDVEGKTVGVRDKKSAALTR